MKLLFIFFLFFSFSSFSQSVQDTIHLNAVASDADGTIVSYQWTQVSGASCTISGTGNAMAVVAFTNPGHYVFQCVVTDNGGKTTTATSSGDVLAANIPPSLKIIPPTFNIQLSK